MPGTHHLDLGQGGVGIYLPLLVLDSDSPEPSHCAYVHTGTCSSHHLLHPRIHAPIRWRVAHMHQPTEKSPFFRLPILKQQEAILDRHEPIMRSIHQQQTTTVQFQNPVLHQAKIALHVAQEVLDSRVAKLFSERGESGPRVLMIGGLLEPRAREKMMRACALAHGTCQPGRVRVCCADRVVPAG